MIVRSDQSRESSLVPHPFGGGTEGNQEEVEFVQPRMFERVRTLGQRWVQSPQEHQGELLAYLPFGAMPTRLAAFAGLDETQAVFDAVDGHDLEGLSDHIDEVVTREPREFCHQAMVPAWARTSRKDT